MLLESEVIDAVCRKLQAHGYSIRQKLKTTQRGDDIIAVKDVPTPCELHIEAKGATSSRKNSQRYGIMFDSAQIRIQIAEALYKTAEVLSRNDVNARLRVGIALPDNEGHRIKVKNIEPVVKQLGIAIFWVKENKEIEVVSDWNI